MDFCSIPLAGELCDVAGAIDFVSDPGAAITEGIGAWIAKSAGELAAAAADLAAEAVNTTTAVDLNASWFRANYAMLLPIGLVLIVATFCAQLVRAAIRRDEAALARAFTGTASGVLFSFFAIAGTTVAIEVVDALSDGLFAAAGTSIEDAVRRTVMVAQIPGMSQLGWMVTAFAAIGAALGGALYWAIMMIRKVGILVLVTLAVFAGAGGGWEVARRWRRGWIEATATLVVSKLLMTIIFLLGISAIGQSEATGGLAALSDVMAGIVIMAMVLATPYATFRFVHWAAEGANGEDLHRAAGSGMQRTRQVTERAGRQIAAGMATGGGGAAAGSAAAPQGPPTVPGQGPGGILAAHPTAGSTGTNADTTAGAGPREGSRGKVLQPPLPPGQDTDSAGTGAATSASTDPAPDPAAARHGGSPPSGAAPSPGAAVWTVHSPAATHDAEGPPASAETGSPPAASQPPPAGT
ncbi:ATP-binding protein [Streptomyces sp. YIM 98790]|uniref:SCO6881 family protein n=1 Tax=Streptomyces sp. YIM 98790 TaxID=2689077 RepID=UPI001408BBBE|nr:ATP-binding protein [Streptomyces sp. YIM 98790]